MKYDATKDWNLEKLLEQYCTIHKENIEDLQRYGMMIKVRIADKTDKLSKRIYWLNVVLTIATAIATIIAGLTFYFNI